jgi:hypothetical protein
MRDLNISSVHHYSNRFLRSTDLSRDFDDPNGLQGYWLTDFGKTCLRRLSDGLKTNSSRRAWRLTGDFGSGKSSFALLLANALRSARERLPSGLRRQVLQELPDAKKLKYIPVLVVGNREAMAPAILRGFQRVLAELFPRGAKSALDVAIEKTLRTSHPHDQEILRLIHQANAKIIQTGKGDGTLLILDEVGKFLEFAALNPEEQDVYFLQQLAEIAARSRKQPLMVVCLLHQGFNAYAEQLAHTTQREWEKIAGRFEEILFHQPLDQVALLVASALNPDVRKIPSNLKKEAELLFRAAIDLGWYGTVASRDTLRRLQHRVFPLDPMVLPVVVRSFQRFGQNERSLFSFLCSHEPFGLRAFSNARLKTDTRLYQLADFYDYIRTNFGYRLAVASYRTHWNVIESVIEARNTEDPLELRVLKTVGLLNLLNTADFVPTEEAAAWAVGSVSKPEQGKVRAVLKKLTKARVLYFRGEARGYSLWPYTSVDIEGRFEEAKRALPMVSQIAQAITHQLDPQPIVARAHYIKTGNLRYFDVVYCMPGELSRAASSHVTQADGVIFVPMCETPAEHKEAKSTAEQIREREGRLIQLIAVPRPLNYLRQAVLDAQRWEWIQSNTAELKDDRFASEEVQLHLQEARNRLQSQIQDFIGLKRLSGGSTLSWFYNGKEQSFSSGRKVLSWLSEICDSVFHEAPTIRNELVNRHNLSSAAAAARMRLLELMFANANKPDLGLPADRKPPEKSMYLSVLKQTGMHHEKDGQWAIGLPQGNDSSHVGRTIQKIRGVISKRPDSRVPIQQLMDTLRRPPYGLRDGLFPILLAVVAIADEQDIAFYENGTFLREVGKDAFLRMTKAPEKFEIQYCKIEGLRSEVFHRLAQMLELSANDGKTLELLDVVRSLCQFVARLPEYVRNTKRLSTITLAVRNVILEAREPVRMMFHDLPESCGFNEFEIGRPASTKEAQQFVLRLKQSLDELRAAFLNLQDRIEKSLAKEFDYGDQSAKQYRPKLAERAEQLLLRVTESKLKAFAFRLFDKGLPESDWLESLGSFLALQPPSKWKDEDEDTFDRELGNLVGRFKRAESLSFGDTPSAMPKIGIRVAVTQADGSERQEVIHIDAEDETYFKRLRDQIAAIIVKNSRLGLAAASRAIWDQLKPAEDS